MPGAGAAGHGRALGPPLQSPAPRALLALRRNAQPGTWSSFGSWSRSWQPSPCRGGPRAALTAPLPGEPLLPRLGNGSN